MVLDVVGSSPTSRPKLNFRLLFHPLLLPPHKCPTIHPSEGTGHGAIQCCDDSLNTGRTCCPVNGGNRSKGDPSAYQILLVLQRFIAGYEDVEGCSFRSIEKLSVFQPSESRVHRRMGKTLKASTDPCGRRLDSQDCSNRKRWEIRMRLLRCSSVVLVDDHLVWLDSGFLDGRTTSTSAGHRLNFRANQPFMQTLSPMLSRRSGLRRWRLPSLFVRISAGSGTWAWLGTLSHLMRSPIVQTIPMKCRLAIEDWSGIGRTAGSTSLIP